MESSGRFWVVSLPTKVIKHEKLRLSRTKRPPPVRISLNLHFMNLTLITERNVQVDVNPLEELFIAFLLVF